MIPTLQFTKNNKRSFPRVSGDDPQSESWTLRAIEFSPRERG